MNDFNGALNESLDDFMESYKITDTEKIYSNGMELVPIFRVKQWFEYNNQDKEIERLNNIINKVIASIEDVRERLNYYGDDNFKVDMSMLTFWIDLLKDSDKE